MKKYKLGFLGAGKMVTAISAGIITNKIYAKSEIIASCQTYESGKKYQKITGGNFTLNNQEVASNSDILVFGVKPQILFQIAEEIKVYEKSQLIISIAAGVKLTALQNYFGDKVVRVMPNIALMIGEGTTAFCCSEALKKEKKEIVNKIFGSVGIIREVEEKNFDLITALSGSGPAYVFEFIESLILGAISLGLDRNLAFDLVIQVVKGSSEMIINKVDTLENLRNAVTSPKGTTFAGLKVMEKNKFRQIILRTLQAAKNRSIELSRGKENGK